MLSFSLKKMSNPPNANDIDQRLNKLNLNEPKENWKKNVQKNPSQYASPFSGEFPLSLPPTNRLGRSLKLDTTPEALNEPHKDYMERPVHHAPSHLSNSFDPHSNSDASAASFSSGNATNNGLNSPPDSLSTPTLQNSNSSSHNSIYRGIPNASTGSIPAGGAGAGAGATSNSSSISSTPVSSTPLSSTASPKGRTASNVQAADMHARIMALQRSRSKPSSRNVSSPSQPGSIYSRNLGGGGSGLNPSSRRTSETFFDTESIGRVDPGLSRSNSSVGGSDGRPTPSQSPDFNTPRTSPPGVSPQDSPRTSTQPHSGGAKIPGGSHSAGPHSAGPHSAGPLSGGPHFPQPTKPPTVAPASNGFDPNTVISPVARDMAAGGFPQKQFLNRAPSFRSKQRSSLSARRGLKLDGVGAAGSTVDGGASGQSGSPRGGVIMGAGEKGNRGLFRDYRKYIDIDSGKLSFKDKACVHAHGIEFSTGEKFNISMDKLEFICEIGSGNYGTVQKLLHKPNNVLMAVKEIRLELDEAALRQIIMELDVLHRCSVDSIIAFYGAFFMEGSVYICMEYMDGGSINKIYEGGIEEKYLKYIVSAVVKGLKELKEDFNIIHRDVKPTNILCSTDGNVKLCDFGVSGNLVASIARTNIGCQAYMAPERIKMDPQNMDSEQGRTYTAESDIWSLGLSIIEMSKGSYPYSSETFQSIFSQLNAIVEDPAPALDPTKYSPEACDFVKRLLSKSPSERPRYSDIVKHPWLANVECTKEEMGEFVKRRVAGQDQSTEVEQPTVTLNSS